MILWALVLFVIGVLLSAFFSGVETGFYRATKVRIVLDARAGDLVARGLWRLINHPTWFVATALVGNNVANYLVSLAIVLGTQTLFAGAGVWVDVIGPILLAPIVFIYGEWMPKNLFFEAPNRLLRRSGPWFLAATVLFLVPCALLYAMSKWLEWISGQSPQRVRLALARSELQATFAEGHEAGVLKPSQRSVAQGLLAVAGQPIRKFATPAGRIVRVRLGMKRREALRIARRRRLSAIAVEEPLGRRRLIGYIRVAELLLDETGEDLPIHPLLDVQANENYITTVMKMHAADAPLARVVDPQGNDVGVVSLDQITEPLFRHA